MKWTRTCTGMQTLHMISSAYNNAPVCIYVRSLVYKRTVYILLNDILKSIILIIYYLILKVLTIFLKH